MSIAKQFKRIFGYNLPQFVKIIQAPGRVNLIGEHIDYNDGWVMPVAINLYTLVVAVPSKEKNVRVFSETFQEFYQWEENDKLPIQKPTWANYVKGVLVGLSRRGLIDGTFDIYIASNLPIGAGLSSSAALEVACSYAFLQHGVKTIESTEVVNLCVQAEHKFAGVECGIMDQVSAIFSRQDQVMVFDTHLNRREFVPFFKDCLIAIIDSGIRRNLSDSRYNLRRSECVKALRLIQRISGLSKIKSWRGISPDLLAKIRGHLPETLFRRGRHIVSEMARVEKAVKALKSKDKQLFGVSMNQSHTSLKDDFEVSISELDLLQNIVCKMPGVYGARLTGAGFGGCLIALIKKKAQKLFEFKLGKKYKIIFTKPSSGTLELLKKNPV